MDLKKLLKKLKKEKQKENNLVGPEIKLRRQRMSKTLEETSLDVCSPSYLCKIEKNSIIPNPKYVDELCERLSFSRIDKESLENLNEIEDELINAFYHDDNLKIRELYNKIADLDNYKAKILKLICNLNFNNILIVGGIISEIDLVVTSMPLEDLVLYTLFRSIYEIKNYRYNDSIKDLRYLLKEKEVNGICEVIAYEYLSIAYYQINHTNFFKIKDILINLHTSYFNFKKVEDLKFKEALLYFYSADYESFDELVKVDFSFKYKNTLILLKSIRDKEVLEEKLEFVSYFYDCLYYYFYDKEEFSKLDKTKLSIYELLFLNVYTIKELSLEDAYRLVSEELYPSSVEISNLYLLDEFFSYSLKRLKEISKYKVAIEFLEKNNEIKRKIKSLC